MKKLVMNLLMVLALVPMAYADEPVIALPTGVEVKQGFVIPWENPENGLMNMSTATIMRTEEWDDIGKWNALWDGWMIDLAWAYDANTSQFGVMLGRHLGTLGKYLPISYPLADKVDITLYPIGVIVADPFNDPDVSGASGAGIIKLSLSF